MDGGRRQVQAAGEFGVGDAAVLLKGVENCTIVIINGVHDERSYIIRANSLNFVLYFRRLGVFRKAAT